MATPIPKNAATFTAEEVVSATGGEFRGDWESVTGVTTNSRAVEPGNLFVALRGERFDGHAFIDQAIEAGAHAVLIDRQATPSDGLPAVVVDDTLEALGDLAHAYRKAWAGTLVGITGSVGKTTTKDLLAAALEANGCAVLKTQGNLNNRIGVPMTLFRLEPRFNTAVIEMGTSQAGEIPRLAAITAPDVTVVTYASMAHTQGLGSVEAVADEKMSLHGALTAEGVAVTYGDDGALRKRAAMVRARRKLFYGRASENDVRVLDREVVEGGTRATVQVRGDAIELRLVMLGEGAVLAAAASLAVVFGLDLDPHKAAKGMSGVTPSAGRLHWRRGRDDRVLIDDSYNASPASVELALETAKQVAELRQAPLVVALGDMKELGDHSERAHKRIGSQVAASGAFLFVGCGSEMHAAVDVASAEGADTLWFEDSSDCGELADRLPLNAVVLVKGSRSMAMERVLEPLLEEPSP